MINMITGVAHTLQTYLPDIVIDYMINDILNGITNKYVDKSRNLHSMDAIHIECTE